MNPQIILGIDPGTVVMGYGIIAVDAKKNVNLVQLGVIHLAKYQDTFSKLQKIYERCSHIIKEYKPQEVAIEAPFYSNNVQSMLKLGRAQGVAMAAALAQGIPITEYAPRKIKQSVCGNGNASKEQIAAMIQREFGFDELPEFLDATDAVAVALCHYYQQRIPQSKNSAKNWEAFLRDNPDRLA